jgi:hypothetical protein
MFRLTAPKHVTFYISVALATLAVVLRLLAYTGISPLRTGGFLILLLGYLALLAGVALEGV